ncbi:MAG TPA: aldo/keto reductase [Steroidobacteraceae bacterium]|nr:aldo/keto reductase [Steroidobacteraceae bacterium]
MEKRTLGSQRLSVSALGLGCMGMSDFYGTRDDARSLETIARALDLGLTLLDTAPMYGPFINEDLVGRAIRGRRDQVVLATKFGVERDPQDPNARRLDSRPATVRASCEDSLRRLGVERIDLFYQHRLDPQVPIEETVGAMADLVRTGKVAHLGLCEIGPQTLARAHAVHPIAAVQSEYSLFYREPEQDILPALRELGVGFVPYSPLGRGFLTGRIRSPSDLEASDWRHNSPRFQSENFDKNLQLVGIVETLAQERGVSPAQIALAWLLAQGDDIVPIPGTKQVQRLEENLGALSIRLSEADLQRLEAAFTPGAVAGARYGTVGVTQTQR